MPKPAQNDPLALNAPPRPKAYETVAQGLLEQIVSGKLVSGDRLPNEMGLAEKLGVSRTTVREALRLLAAQDLIRTSKGAGGGSYITVPRVDRINAFMLSSINLLSGAKHVTISELLEARELLEIPAARLAAERRSEDDMERLRSAIPPPASKLHGEQQFQQNREFHACVLDACGNTLLSIAAQPVFGVLMKNVARSTFGTSFNRQVSDQHTSIASAIEAGEATSAGDLMHEHLEFLRPVYEKAWTKTKAQQA
jgi:DNA-binding FadR family transcriptional regulator